MSFLSHLCVCEMRSQFVVHHWVWDEEAVSRCTLLCVREEGKAEMEFHITASYRAVLSSSRQPAAPYLPPHPGGSHQPKCGIHQSPVLPNQLDLLQEIAGSKWKGEMSVLFLMVFDILPHLLCGGLHLVLVAGLLQRQLRVSEPRQESWTDDILNKNRHGDFWPSQINGQSEEAGFSPLDCEAWHPWGSFVHGASSGHSGVILLVHQD